MPLISCIVTTCNEGPLALRSLQSLLGQGVRDLEVIVVDDGSTDATPELVAALAEATKDPRLRLIRQANDGLSSARNRGLAHARGDWVTFLDADDSRPGWALAAIAEALRRDDPDLLLCRGALVDVRGAPEPFYDTARFDAVAALGGDGPITPDHPRAAEIRALAQLIEPQSANKLVRRDLIARHGLRFPDSHLFEDIFFHATALAAAERLAFLHSPVFTYYRRYQRAQITAGKGAARFDILAVVRMTLQALERGPTLHQPLQRAAVMAACLKLIRWCEAELGHARRAEFRAMTAALLRLVDPLWSHLPAPGAGLPGSMPPALVEPLAAARAALDEMAPEGLGHGV